MCNLYHMTPKNDLEVYVRRHLSKLWLPEQDPTRPFVGPFDTGLFLRAGQGDSELTGALGQWALIRPGASARKDMMQPKPVPGKKAPAPRPRTTNNARLETVATSPTFRAAWNEGRRCLIPAQWYQEPNWETGRNIWWQLRRADGLPWMLAGIWNEWVDPMTGEVVPNYAMLTCNCDGHPLLGRLHRPDARLPAEAQDKRAVMHLEPHEWDAWLRGSEPQARALLRTREPAFFDAQDAHRTDALLAQP
ncbi:Putative SOS response-associated peptidase YedK [Roseateles sp. YR242]|uniref:SOS response-associated peptidase family protein n=1 Tax=Roseateles sp. YR242 TaxID=1855305 RepID=UPI0008D0D00B|nr:SOS response-associated peptidase family protein [Roseateles sp. YR242]SEL10910.1 Putative SOS response-associated peptidase YedK [Roseateles sp. YR242]